MPRTTSRLPAITNGGLPKARWTTSLIWPGAAPAGGGAAAGGGGGGAGVVVGAAAEAVAVTTSRAPSRARSTAKQGRERGFLIGMILSVSNDGA